MDNMLRSVKGEREGMCPDCLEYGMVMDNNNRKFMECSLCGHRMRKEDYAKSLSKIDELSTVTNNDSHTDRPLECFKCGGELRSLNKERNGFDYECNDCKSLFFKEEIAEQREFDDDEVRDRNLMNAGLEKYLNVSPSADPEKHQYVNPSVADTWPKCEKHGCFMVGKNVGGDTQYYCAICKMNNEQSIAAPDTKKDSKPLLPKTRDCDRCGGQDSMDLEDGIWECVRCGNMSLDQKPALGTPVQWKPRPKKPTMDWTGITDPSQYGGEGSLKLMYAETRIQDNHRLSYDWIIPNKIAVGDVANGLVMSHKGSAEPFDAILNVSQYNYTPPPGVEYYHDFIDEHGTKKVNYTRRKKALLNAVNKLDQWIKDGKTVHVHCTAGMNRSPSVVALYLALKKGMDPKEAIALVEKKRAVASVETPMINVMADILGKKPSELIDYSSYYNYYKKPALPLKQPTPAKPTVTDAIIAEVNAMGNIQKGEYFIGKPMEQWTHDEWIRYQNATNAELIQGAAEGLAKSRAPQPTPAVTTKHEDSPYGTKPIAIDTVVKNDARYNMIFGKKPLDNNTFFVDILPKELWNNLISSKLIDDQEFKTTGIYGRCRTAFNEFADDPTVTNLQKLYALWLELWEVVDEAVDDLEHTPSKKAIRIDSSESPFLVTGAKISDEQYQKDLDFMRNINGDYTCVHGVNRRDGQQCSGCNKEWKTRLANFYVLTSIPKEFYNQFKRWDDFASIAVKALAFHYGEGLERIVRAEGYSTLRATSNSGGKWKAPPKTYKNPCKRFGHQFTKSPGFVNDIGHTCSVCKKEEPHKWENNAVDPHTHICTVCDHTMSHDWESMDESWHKCSVCQNDHQASPHQYVPSRDQEYKCALCDMEPIHYLPEDEEKPFFKDFDERYHTHHFIRIKPVKELQMNHPDTPDLLYAEKCTECGLLQLNSGGLQQKMPWFNKNNPQEWSSEQEYYEFKDEKTEQDYWKHKKHNHLWNHNNVCDRCGLKQTDFLDAWKAHTPADWAGEQIDPATAYQGAHTHDLVTFKGQYICKKCHKGAYDIYLELQPWEILAPWKSHSHSWAGSNESKDMVQLCNYCNNYVGDVIDLLTLLKKQHPNLPNEVGTKSPDSLDHQHIWKQTNVGYVGTSARQWMRSIFKEYHHWLDSSAHASTNEKQIQYLQLAYDEAKTLLSPAPSVGTRPWDVDDLLRTMLQELVQWTADAIANPDLINNEDSSKYYAKLRARANQLLNIGVSHSYFGTVGCVLCDATVPELIAKDTYSNHQHDFKLDVHGLLKPVQGMGEIHEPTCGICKLGPSEIAQKLPEIKQKQEFIENIKKNPAGAEHVHFWKSTVSEDGQPSHKCTKCGLDKYDIIELFSSRDPDAGKHQWKDAGYNKYVDKTYDWRCYNKDCTHTTRWATEFASLLSIGNKQIDQWKPCEQHAFAYDQLDGATACTKCGMSVDDLIQSYNYLAPVAQAFSADPDHIHQFTEGKCACGMTAEAYATDLSNIAFQYFTTLEESYDAHAKIGVESHSWVGLYSGATQVGWQCEFCNKSALTLAEAGAAINPVNHFHDWKKLSDGSAAHRCSKCLQIDWENANKVNDTYKSYVTTLSNLQQLKSEGPSTTKTFSNSMQQDEYLKQQMGNAMANFKDIFHSFRHDWQPVPGYESTQTYCAVCNRSPQFIIHYIAGSDGDVLNCHMPEDHKWVKSGPLYINGQSVASAKCQDCEKYAYAPTGTITDCEYADMLTTIGQGVTNGFKDMQPAYATLSSSKWVAASAKHAGICQHQWNTTDNIHWECDRCGSEAMDVIASLKLILDVSPTCKHLMFRPSNMACLGCEKHITKCAEDAEAVAKQYADYLKNEPKEQTSVNLDDTPTPIEWASTDVIKSYAENYSENCNHEHKWHVYPNNYVECTHCKETPWGVISMVHLNNVATIPGHSHSTDHKWEKQPGASYKCSECHWVDVDLAERLYDVLHNAWLSEHGTTEKDTQKVREHDPLPSLVPLQLDKLPLTPVQMMHELNHSLVQYGHQHQWIDTGDKPVHCDICKKYAADICDNLHYLETAVTAPENLCSLPLHDWEDDTCLSCFVSALGLADALSAAIPKAIDTLQPLMSGGVTQQPPIPATLGPAEPAFSTPKPNTVPEDNQKKSFKLSALDVIFDSPWYQEMLDWHQRIAGPRPKPPVMQDPAYFDANTYRHMLDEAKYPISPEMRREIERENERLKKKDDKKFRQKMKRKPFKQINNFEVMCGHTGCPREGKPNVSRVEYYCPKHIFEFRRKEKERDTRIDGPNYYEEVQKAYAPRSGRPAPEIDTSIWFPYLRVQVPEAVVDSTQPYTPEKQGWFDWVFVRKWFPRTQWKPIERSIIANPAAWINGTPDYYDYVEPFSEAVELAAMLDRISPRELEDRITKAISTLPKYGVDTQGIEMLFIQQLGLGRFWHKKDATPMDVKMYKTIKPFIAKHWKNLQKIMFDVEPEMAEYYKDDPTPPAPLWVEAVSEGRKLGKGSGTSAGVVTGIPAFEASEVAPLANQGKNVILMCEETTPDDVAAMSLCVGFAMSGGTASGHTALMARGKGKPCIVGLGFHRNPDNPDEIIFPSGEILNRTKDEITMNGHETAGTVVIAGASTMEAEKRWKGTPLDPEYEEKHSPDDTGWNNILKIENRIKRKADQWAAKNKNLDRVRDFVRDPDDPLPLEELAMAFRTRLHDSSINAFDGTSYGGGLWALITTRGLQLQEARKLPWTDQAFLVDQVHTLEHNTGSIFMRKWRHWGPANPLNYIVKPFLDLKAADHALLWLQRSHELLPTVKAILADYSKWADRRGKVRTDSGPTNYWCGTCQDLARVYDEPCGRQPCGREHKDEKNCQRCGTPITSHSIAGFTDEQLERMQNIETQKISRARAHTEKAKAAEATIPERLAYNCKFPQYIRVKLGTVEGLWDSATNSLIWYDAEPEFNVRAFRGTPDGFVNILHHYEESLQ